MVAFKGTSLLALVASLLAYTAVASPLAHAAPDAAVDVKKSPLVARQSSSYWLANIKRQALTNYAPSGYKLYRNVVADFGADPTGARDSTDAINAAISSGSRCGQGCDSTTVTPAIVYFPPGTYLVSRPIIQYYYSQLIGDAVNPPTIKAAASFQGMAVIDADPYDANGVNWFTNQNNFFRQVRNFVIDLTAMPQTAGAGIHWQVAQATSLQNIVFNMIPGSGSKQLGIFMDNGSGGFMSDLTFNGGQYGAFYGSQQFTTRNLVFNNVQTAIFMNWNWGWTMAGVTINNCGIGLDMSNGPANQTVGSVIMMDSKISNTPIGIKTAFTLNPVSVPNGGGSLVIDNVDMSANVPNAVVNANNGQILAGNRVIQSWAQGRYYNSASGRLIQGGNAAPTKSAQLLDSSGKFFTRSKPQYQNVAVGNFISIRSFGAVGNGVADDTAAFQRAMAAITGGQILYIDHGAYVITSTIVVPPNIKIVGEHWPLIFATGSFFGDQRNPRPFWQVGTPGQSGSVEMQDLMFETKGPAPGASMMQWNLKSTPGASGLWDVHFRIGGTAGTNLQSTQCTKNPTVAHGANSACIGSNLLFHVTPSASGVYLENTWLWVSDHELDIRPYNQIDIYNGRGLLVESTGPSWFWGTSSEHNTLYNYQISKASNVFMGFIQTETPYYQGNPVATTPFAPNATWSDPNFSICPSGQAKCVKSFGLRIQNSNNVYVYGAGMYSFFENYSQDCVYPNNCQQHMTQIEGTNSNLYMYALSTKAAINMVTLPNGNVLDADNRSNFCATVAGFQL
ncbi:hypothetical protein KVT40_007594 [Elsinoe batatas]|uniref:Rhamnogalacturonase A/B/Epimerase-like pectate lyase domain-containing protein n=1 Tax=Elsinoe batatas TaxID=2601811 RepID=A0A8K0PDF1_9PEZI|nr:hypothetical protein KVT40_007594 [Elsinoe batatas]